jgi:hypothetical protein
VLKQCLERTLALERAEEEQGGFFRRGKGKGKKGEKGESFDSHIRLGYSGW